MAQIPAPLWLWRRLAAAARIRPLDFKPPHALGVAIKKKKEKANSHHFVDTAWGQHWRERAGGEGEDPAEGAWI